ncbi:hypothetical protein F4604DRAFT_1743718 [Suillus subluteus]|nr:hypothetical protein F4604DRAFT_1743718 [Suillus subluteus]
MPGTHSPLIAPIVCKCCGTRCLIRGIRSETSVRAPRHHRPSLYISFIPTSLKNSPPSHSTKLQNTGPPASSTLSGDPAYSLGNRTKSLPDKINLCNRCIMYCPYHPPLRLGGVNASDHIARCFARAVSKVLGNPIYHGVNSPYTLTAKTPTW